VKFGVITAVTLNNNNNNNIFRAMEPSSGRNLKTFTKNLVIIEQYVRSQPPIQWVPGLDRG
jgi:hypothetical protein